MTFLRHRTTVFGVSLLLMIAGTASEALAWHAREFTLVIDRVREAGSCLEGRKKFNNNCRGNPDFFPVVTIDGIRLSARRVSDRDDVRPNWRFPFSLTSTSIASISLEIWDSDSGTVSLRGGNDQADINPQSGRTLDLEVIADVNGSFCGLYFGSLAGGCNRPLQFTGDDKNRTEITLHIEAPGYPTGSTLFLVTDLPELWSRSRATAAERACHASVQGRIPWDYKNSRTWNAVNVQRLCRGTSQGQEPARCFERVMHGGINWGGGTFWKWENALDLCEGTNSAYATISCFQSSIGSGNDWESAIRRCQTR